MKNSKFNHRTAEKKWQAKWEEEGLYNPDMDNSNNPFYNLWMFPYPSAEGLHAGHAFASTGSDVYGRFMRMRGKTVFQPIGYDSFGIHSENYALKIGENPKAVVKRTTGHYEEQCRSLGHGYDWTRTVTTSDISYYHFTEWLFATLFKSGLAYRKKAEVNFCPSCKTVLADEQVMSPKQAGKEPKDVNGNIVAISEDLKVCERCGTVSEKRELKQWFFRITDYAERLLVNLGKIDWSERVKVAQKEWIGKKRGINISYDIEGSSRKVVVWTSRPDTNFGATFIVLALENPIALEITDPSNKREVEEYIKLSKSKSKEDRLSEGKDKTGVFTGAYAINNLNGYKMPIYVTDFVLSDVGTGAVVGVPAHDKRDFQFAKKFNLPIKRVVLGSDGKKSEINSEEEVQEEEGTMINSGFLNGLDIHEATNKMMDYLEEKGWGIKTTSYHLRDWLISRQRYWGCPIPMIYCEKCAKEGKSYFSLAGSDPAAQKSSKFALQGPTLSLIHPDQSDWESLGWYPVLDDELPVKLPDIVDWKPEGNGKGPLANHPDYFKTKCPACGSPAERETDVCDTFLDSSWYFLRYPSVGSKTAKNLAFDPEITKKWLPVNLYFGGAEHSVLHLMYARFITMVLFDAKHLNFEEPFPQFFAHGLMIKDGAKMSKSRGNVVNPDEYVKKFGADALRLYLMFMGPMDGSPDFRDTGIEGMSRFIDRLWSLFSSLDKKAKEDHNLTVKMHQTIKKVIDDIETFSYNTAIAKIMEYVNLIREKKNYASVYLETLVKLIAPFAPHLSEEIYQKYFGDQTSEVGGRFQSIHTSQWPQYISKYIKEDQDTIVVQVNGKLRSSFVVDSSVPKVAVIKLAKEDSKILPWIEGKKIIKEIFVPGKLVNFVV